MIYLGAFGKFLTKNNLLLYILEHNSKHKTRFDFSINSF